MPEKINDLNDLLNASAATADFKSAVLELKESGKSSAAISFAPGTPPVKVLRTVTKLIEVEPGVEISNVEVKANSGCSDFVGTISVNDGGEVYNFVWDCAWRAKQENWEDHFGYPDQIRAAREYGYQCFEKFVKA